MVWEHHTSVHSHCLCVLASCLFVCISDALTQHGTRAALACLNPHHNAFECCGLHLAGAMLASLNMSYSHSENRGLSPLSSEKTILHVVLKLSYGVDLL